jgi:hypothetical protein
VGLAKACYLLQHINSRTPDMAVSLAFYHQQRPSHDFLILESSWLGFSRFNLKSLPPQDGASESRLELLEYVHARSRPRTRPEAHQHMHFLDGSDIEKSQALLSNMQLFSWHFLIYGGEYVKGRSNCREE